LRLNKHHSKKNSGQQAYPTLSIRADTGKSIPVQTKTPQEFTNSGIETNQKGINKSYMAWAGGYHQKIWPKDPRENEAHREKGQ
jgi:hypothetical protein